MTKYREILRLHSRGISGRSIAASCECSRNTVTKVLARAAELSISWPLKAETTGGSLELLVFSNSPELSESRRYPDMEYLHKEMGKTSVTLWLLWTEYCAECRLSNDLPLMYSQFCHYYQKFAEKKRATIVERPDWYYVQW